MDVEEHDINKNPPTRAFLEKHVDADRFLDFVSTRSPVFKQRPLPRSKKEAIDLMMEQPNLIRRPILIEGNEGDLRLRQEARIRQARERRARSMGEIRIGTSGWSYPTGKGTWNGIFYPVPPGRRSSAAAASTTCGSTPSTSTRSKSIRRFTACPAPATARGWAERTPPGFEFSLKLFQKFTHPEMFLKATGGDPWTLGQKDVDEFRAAIDPLASAGKLGALLAQFPASFRNEPDTRAYLEWLLERVQGLPRRPRTAPPELERSTGRNAAAARCVRRRVGADRRAEVPVLDPAEPPAERADVLLPAPARPERRAVVEAREVRRPLQLPVFRRRAAAVRRGGQGSVTRSEESVPLREQPFLGEVGGQRRDPETRSRSAARRASTRRSSSIAIRT